MGKQHKLYTQWKFTEYRQTKKDGEFVRVCYAVYEIDLSWELGSFQFHSFQSGT